MLAAYGTGRWTYLDHAGQRRVYTLIDGAFCGSPAASERDGIDIKSSILPGANQMEYADVEILEAAYPLLFLERRATTGFHGYGKHRSGAGCQEAFTAYGTDALVGNMTGTRAWFPTPGSAGGYPGATMNFAVRRTDGAIESVDIHETGVTLAPGDMFEMMCASGGGYGDPLDRRPEAVRQDFLDRRIDLGTAIEVYGVDLDEEGELDLASTQERRASIRLQRLKDAKAACCPAEGTPDPDLPPIPLYPGVIQRANLAIAKESGAVLAVAPDSWLGGCPVLDMPIDDRAGGTVARAHLDPLTGRMLFVDVLRKDDGPSIEICTDRWSQAGHNLRTGKTMQGTNR
jgi:N-methylhydantoinase B